MIDQAESRDEEEVFHAWNDAQDSGRPLVLVADEAPPAWSPKLPDLRTRLAITPVATISQPDDALFEALIQLLFRRSRTPCAARGASLHDRAPEPRILDRGTRGRRGRSLRDFGTGAGYHADHPAGAFQRENDRRRGLAAGHAFDTVLQVQFNVHPLRAESIVIAEPGGTQRRVFAPDRA